MYKSMLLDAKKKGLTNEHKMWESVDAFDTLLDTMREEHPDEYWRFIRNQHELLYGAHYDEKFADEDVSKFHSMSKEGKELKGAHWTMQEVKDATKSMILPAGVTDCDVYVAMNGLWHDLHSNFSDGDILEIAYLFFFNDDDFKGDKGTKVWRYFNIK